MAKGERIPILQALQAVTINAAYQLGVDDRYGSLEVGKVADLVAVSANPLRTPAAELKKIEVRRTWLAGQPTASEAKSQRKMSLALPAVRSVLQMK